MAVDFFLNVLDGTHLVVFDAIDDGPAVVCGGSLTGAAAGSQIVKVLFVNVRTGVCGCFLERIIFSVKSVGTSR